MSMEGKEEEEKEKREEKEKYKVKSLGQLEKHDDAALGLGATAFGPYYFAVFKLLVAINEVCNRIHAIWVSLADSTELAVGLFIVIFRVCTLCMESISPCSKRPAVIITWGLTQCGYAEVQGC